MEHQKNTINTLGNRIDAVLTDFDGTLINSFKANFLAYQEVLNKYNYSLSIEEYKASYGLNFKDLMDNLHIDLSTEKLSVIKEEKAIVYPKYFCHIRLNNNLLNFILYLKKNDIRIAIVSTATKRNIINIIKYFNIEAYFDILVTSDDIENGKPNPDCYLTAARLLNVDIKNCLIFEDSDYGTEAAFRAGGNFITLKYI